MSNTSIVKGSIAAIAKDSGKSLAHTFVDADVVVLVDTSGSMGTCDSRAGHSRYDVACDELAALQNSLPGKVAVISFSDRVMFCPNGIPLNLRGGTDIAGALRFARVADVPGMRFILISDGEPDDPQAALAEARQFKAQIDVIYVGSEILPTGRDFLTQLARASGGQAVTADQAKQLASIARRLLNG
jgi:Mg-chelatase subunit ChlD